MKLVWLFLSLTACTTPTAIYMSSQRFQTPATEGGFLNGAAGVIGGGSVTVNPMHDLSAVPANSQAQIGQPSQWGALGFTGALLGQLGLFKFMDLVLQGNQLGVKVQIFGADSNEGWKSSLQFLSSPGLDYTSMSGNNTLTAKVSNQDSGVSIGYAYASRLTLYGSFGHRSYTSAESLDQNGVWTRWSDQGYQNILGMGFTLPGETYFAGMECSYVETGWSRTSAFYESSVGGVFGIRW